METKIVLVVRNVDLDDDGTVEKLGAHLDGLSWQEERGQVTATVLTEATDPVSEALAAAKAIEGVLPGALVERADDQLVALSDIAARTGLSHEAVRLWASGKRRAHTGPFPAPRTQVGQGQSTTKIWAWPDVIAWLRTQYCLDPEPEIAYLSVAQTARINATLCDRTARSGRWQVIGVRSVTRVLSAVDHRLDESAMVRHFALASQ